MCFIYLALVQKFGFDAFSIATSDWDKMSPTSQWAVNQAFLDKAIQAGKKFTLSANAHNIITGTYFYREIQYLLVNGYKIAEYGWTMVKK